jgi:hypothetical protein
MSRAMVATVNPLSVACDSCPAGVGSACWDGAYRTRTPHPSRTSKARCVLLDREARAESQWLELAAIWRDASEADRAGILAAVKARMALPRGVDAVVRVLGCHGTFAVLPDRQNPLEHARAAHRHLMRTMNVVDVQADPVWPIDNGAGGTGELHVACVGGRALITCELVGRGRR